MNPLVRTAALILSGFLISSPSFSQTGPPVPDFLRDLNQDGTIDFKDLLILIESWGLEGIETPTPTLTETPMTVSTETATPTPTPTNSETPTETPTPSPTETPVDQNSFTVEIPFPAPIPLKMIRIPAGSFMMGSPDTERGRASDEGPVHQVNIGYDFYMSETEVTRGQWESVMGSLPSCTSTNYGTGVNLPVFCVSWLDCQDFLAALNSLSQEGNFRLPSEAEWEYACRAGSTKRFYFGNALECSDEVCEDCDIDPSVREKSTTPQTPGSLPEFQSKIGLPMTRKASEFMWFCANSDTRVHQVRSLRPNAFGLYDMSGNVHEWVQDLYHPDYTGAPTDGSAWLTGGVDVKMVYRGGYFAIEAGFCRSAGRYSLEPTETFAGIGFRIVWTP